VRKYLLLTLVAALLLAACKSTSNSASTTASTGTTTAVATDTRAPGVTSDSIKVGIVWVDLSSLVSVLHINEGSFPKAYQAIVDNINAHGGIHGRKLDATLVGVNPTQQTAADSACTQLTQDDKVFVAVGFFLADNVLCYVNTNATAAIGGAQTPARLAQAKAPWYSTDAGENLEINVVKTLAKQGKLNGKLAVMATAADQDLLNTKIKPALAAAGIKPVSSAILDAPTNDTTATYAQAATISEKFKADGATQVLLVGESAAGSYLPGLAKTDYRPQVVLSDLNGVSAYLGNKGNDFSVLKNAISGGPFGPNDAQLALGGPTKACMDIQRKAGLVIKPSSTVAAGDPDQFVASALACQQMALLTAILQKAGPTLNYGTFAAAGNSLGKIVLPTAPGPWDFGAPPNADGNPTVYLFKWDPTTSTFIIATPAGSSQGTTTTSG
jgi:hypothetical protein